ncbi:MAG: hypothetical protein IMW93_06885 [Thermoanaerobacteraceae bacterium]|nr:hypothetical protein [Thermoanaerobacteraceae bacterium]
MRDDLNGGHRIALVMLGGKIPAIGPRVKVRREAVVIARRYMEKIDRMIAGCRSSSYSILLLRQHNGLYTLRLCGGGMSMEILQDMDELLLWRFRKVLHRGLFILTAFCQGERGLECLAVTEGLGAVIYTPRQPPVS